MNVHQQHVLLRELELALSAPTSNVALPALQNVRPIGIEFPRHRDAVTWRGWSVTTSVGPGVMHDATCRLRARRDETLMSEPGRAPTYSKTWAAPSPRRAHRSPMHTTHRVRRRAPAHRCRAHARGQHPPAPKARAGPAPGRWDGVAAIMDTAALTAVKIVGGHAHPRAATSTLDAEQHWNFDERGGGDTPDDLGESLVRLLFQDERVRRAGLGDRCRAGRRAHGAHAAPRGPHGARCRSP